MKNMFCQQSGTDIPGLKKIVELKEAAQRQLATFARQGVRTARVVQERPDVTTYALRLPKATPSMRNEVAALAGKNLVPKALLVRHHFAAEQAELDKLTAELSRLEALRAVNPNIEVRVVWTSSWYDPGKEADAAKALFDQGADIIVQHTDSTAAIQVAEMRLPMNAPNRATGVCVCSLIS